MKTRLRNPSTSSHAIVVVKYEGGLDREAASRLNPEEKNVIRSVIESIVLRNTVKAAERRFAPADSGGNTP